MQRNVQSPAACTESNPMYQYSYFNCKSYKRKSPPSSLPLQWPYCLRRCTYCNFNKYIPGENNDLTMTECLQRETDTLLQLSQVSWYGNSVSLPT